MRNKCSSLQIRNQVSCDISMPYLQFLVIRLLNVRAISYNSAHKLNCICSDEHKHISAGSQIVAIASAVEYRGVNCGFTQ